MSLKKLKHKLKINYFFWIRKIEVLLTFNSCLANIVIQLIFQPLIESDAIIQVEKKKRMSRESGKYNRDRK